MYDIPRLETNGVAPNTTSPSTMSRGSRQWRHLKHDNPGLKTTPLSHEQRPLAWHLRAQDNAAALNTTAPSSKQRRHPKYDDSELNMTVLPQARHPWA
jgi:hypothetical protein